MFSAKENWHTVNLMRHCIAAFTAVRIEEDVLLVCESKEVARKVAVVKVRTFWRQFNIQ